LVKSPITEAKQHWAWLVLGWVTAWKHHALLVKRSLGLAHPTSLTELALLDGRKPLPLGDIIGLTLTLTLTLTQCYVPFLNQLFTRCVVLDGHWRRGSLMKRFILLQQFSFSYEYVFLNPRTAYQLDDTHELISQTVKFNILAASINTDIEFISGHLSTSINWFVI
jgi:hypothetical protein